MNKLGFGFLRLPRLEEKDPSSLDFSVINPMIDRFLAAGRTYFDTAYTYLDGASETGLKPALVERYPRSAFWITSKLPSWKVKTEEDCQRYFSEQLARCGVDVFDGYLLHWLNAKNYAIAERFHEFEFIQNLKEQGLVKKTGFSYHDGPELLEEILQKHPEVDYVQLQINYLDWESPTIQSRACYEVAVRHGKPVIVMEPVKGGSLAKLPPEAEALLREMHPDWTPADWAVRFAQSLPGVEVVLSGMNSLQQMEDNLREVEPLTAEELALLEKVAGIIRENTAIACTACNYCAPNCPKKIAIPRYFSLYNEYARSPGEGWKMGHSYRAVAAENGTPGDCIACGACERNCPQKLPIIQHLKTVKGAFEG